MSRSGYIDDDGDDPLAMGRWRGTVANALRGKRGQAFLRETLAALDAMADKRLIAQELEAEGEFCTLGVVGAARGFDLTAINPDDYEAVAKAFGIAPCMAQEIVWENDERVDEWKWVEVSLCGPVRPWERDYIDCRIADKDAGQKRWAHMRKWVADHIKSPEAAAKPAEPTLPTQGDAK